MIFPLCLCSRYAFGSISCGHEVKKRKQRWSFCGFSVFLPYQPPEPILYLVWQITPYLPRAIRSPAPMIMRLLTALTILIIGFEGSFCGCPFCSYDAVKETHDPTTMFAGDDLKAASPSDVHESKY